MRELVRGMCNDWTVLIRTACVTIGFDRSTFHDMSRRADQAAIERRIKEICETCVCFGYRREHVLLDREGCGVTVEKAYRIYRGLGMRKPRPFRLVNTTFKEKRVLLKAEPIR